MVENAGNGSEGTQYGMDPPPGVVPNYKHPNKTVYTASIVTQVLCISIVGAILCLRIHTRVNILGVFHMEDWLITVGFSLALSYSIVALVMNHYGGGMNQWEVELKNMGPFGITVYCTMILYGPCAFAIKASILIFLARIFAPINSAVLFLRTFLAFLLTYYILVLALKAAICRPVAKFWITTLDGECFDQRSLILADSIISVLSDAVLFVAPLPLTCNLHMKRKRRAKVAAVFSAGGLAVICSVIRLIDIVKNGTSENQTLVFMRVNLWGIAEVYIGIITACMPVLPAFWKHHFGSDEQTNYSRYNYTANHSLDAVSARRTYKNNTYPSHQKPSQDFGSDKNILITDMFQPSVNGSKSTSFNEVSVSIVDIRASKEHVLLPPPSPTYSVLGQANEGVITKTVEIQQTYD